ncbi:hypothetical protein PHET_06384 [Paragonimus heterotremus]|uniref:Dynein heavy chain n=1 Tax=Paragonimus heterotremus TaxID=100268 RepID=A0A8J4SYZ4_9TREM|nr:hypothetical protein PHET_06384 [Paragonimus heterotremus]
MPIFIDWTHDVFNDISQNMIPSSEEVEDELDRLEHLLNQAQDVLKTHINEVIERISHYILIELPEPTDTREADQAVISDCDITYSGETLNQRSCSVGRISTLYRSPWKSSAWDVYDLVRAIHRRTVQGATEIQLMSQSVEEAANRYINMLAGDFYQHMQRFEQGTKSYLEFDNQDDKEEPHNSAHNDDDDQVNDVGGRFSLLDNRTAFSLHRPAQVKIPFTTTHGASEEARRQKLTEKIYATIDEQLRSFGQRTLDAVIKAVRTSLEEVWRHFGMREAGSLLKDVPIGRKVNAGSVKPHPLVKCEVIFSGERLLLRPSLEEIQTAIRAINGCLLTCTKYIGKWTETHQRTERLFSPGLRGLVARFPVAHVLPSKLDSGNQFDGKKDPSLYDRSSIVLMHSASAFLGMGQRKVSGSQMDQSGTRDTVTDDKTIFMRKCIDLFITQIQHMSTMIEDYDRTISRPISNLDDIFHAIDMLTKFHNKEVSMDMMLLKAEDTQAMLNRYELELPQEHADRIEATRWALSRLTDRAASTMDRISEVQQNFQRELIESSKQIRRTVQAFMADYHERGPMTPGLTQYEAFDRQLFFRSAHEQLMRKVESCARGERLFGLTPISMDGLKRIGQQLELLQCLYGLYSEVNGTLEMFAYTMWRDADMTRLQEKLTEFLHKCQHLPKTLKHWPAYFELSTKLTELVSKLPLLSMLRNSAMKPRHWEQIEALLGVNNLDPEATDVTVGTMLSLPIATSDGTLKDQVEEVCIGAAREKDIEIRLNTVIVEWSQQDLELMPFKNRGNLLLRGERVQEILQQLDESMLVLAALSNNRYNVPFRSQIQKWVHALSTTCETLEIWLRVQNLWVYLEAVFIGSDLAKQLPKEAKSFHNIDRNWVRLMERAWDTPNVVMYCTADPSLQELLPRLLEQLEVCQRSLSSYLECKRRLFPRFYFVSDSVLLEILGQSSEPRSVQKHLLTVFENTKYLSFSDDAMYDTIEAAYSSEDEELKLLMSVQCQGPVESWLSRLLATIQGSIHELVHSSYIATYEDEFQLLPFLDHYPAQVGILGLQFLWTREAAYALDEVRYDPKIMQHTNKHFQQFLLQLIERTTFPLNTTERTKYETFITIHLHQKDIFDELDMGRCLGQYVVLFNCSDQMDFRGLGRIFKGLAQSGVWGCFDEFNRLELPVLSVAAQQIAVVLQAKRDLKSSFVFSDGELVTVNPEFGIFITTSEQLYFILTRQNPGYAGRRRLPENLKVSFRMVAMMVPDRQMIIRVKLAACGFVNNMSLARKFHCLNQLCEEQLTKQVHYDFGLRNVLTVLRTLGAYRRAHKTDPEEQVVMRVLRDMNLSKLVDQDEPLFLSMLEDLFPGETSLRDETETALYEVLHNQTVQLGLIPHKPWLTKVQNLYDMQRVRHGVMILGPPGSGKSKGIAVLLKALTERGEPHRELRMNPKAVTTAEMFGHLNASTHDWIDGIFTTLWRRTMRLKSHEHCWIVLDGPVDAIWIENLNSVLDDNKTLTLANGDRIPMVPNCKVVFEVDSVDNASPATISRNGMVYISSASLPWSPLFEAWMQTQTKCVRDAIGPVVDNLFPSLMKFLEIESANRMVYLEAFYIRQFCDLFSGMVDEQADNAKLVNMAMFCLIWSCGCLLDVDERIKMDHYLRKIGPRTALPVGENQSSVFDFRVNELGKWIPWSECVEDFNDTDVDQPFHNMLIPNGYNVVTQFLLHTIGKQKKAPMLVGESGTGKTVIIRKYLNQLKSDKHNCKVYSFSSSTTPALFQRGFETFIERRVGSTYGPPGGKRLTVFIDDINMPVINEWGDQVVNELVRQLIEMGGVYSLDKVGEFLNVMDVQVSSFAQLNHWN